MGRMLRLSVFGESHGPVVGGVIDGVPPGMQVESDQIQVRMDERRPGTSAQVSARKETDVVKIVSGVNQGRTTGAPIAFTIDNMDVRGQDYDVTQHVPRPGHADLVESRWSRGHNHKRGSGHRSGRLTAPWVAAAALVQPLLTFYGIDVDAQLVEVGGVSGSHEDFVATIDAARRDKDSIGGKIRFQANGVPPALGSPMMDGLSSALANTLFAIPGVKGVDIGAGFQAASMRGSEHNDAYAVADDGVRFQSNHAGGILGGRTTGQPVWGHVAFKPSSSIAQPQQSVDLEKMENVSLEVRGRHDPCVAVRGAPVVRAAVELVLADMLLQAASLGHVKPAIWDKWD
jgi:chorismate synthase